MMSIGGVVFSVASFAVALLWRPLRRHRTDLTRGQHAKEGSELLASLNILNSDNYDQDGKKLLKWMYVLTICQLIGAGIMLAAV